MTVRVVMSDLFQKSQSHLDGSMKSRVLDFIVKLQQNPDSPGLQLKSPQGVADSRVKVGRVNDFYRAVVVELPHGTGYVLAAVRPHDDAYDYAGRLRFGVNEVTGALEVADQAETLRMLDAVETSAATPPEATPVLADVGAGTLVKFGLGADLAERLTGITDETAFYEVVDTLPRAQGDAVLDLATGRTPEDVWDDLVQREPTEPIDPDDVEAALHRPLSRLSFVPFENEEEFRAALEGDLDKWRVWLHPLQRTLAEHGGWNGPYRVTGGAGTGKTVTAIHRARHLAERVRREVTSGEAPAGSKVLVTTFTRNLATAIQAQLVKLAGPGVLDQVEVANIDRLAQRVWRGSGGVRRGERVLGDTSDEVREAWSTAASGTDYDSAFLESEWRDVVVAQGLVTREEYLQASRAGRGRRLSRPQRAEVWQLLERFQQILSASDAITFMQVVDRAADVAGEDFRYAVVDEAQDLHPAHWRLLRALVRRGADDLFIVGDAHQRIYGRPVVLSRLGIETRGRSRRLTVNYRTSRQILRWCLATAGGIAVDDLEGDDETLGGARSVFDGPAPEAYGFASSTLEAQAVAARLAAWHQEGLAWKDMAGAARDRRSLDGIEAALHAAQIPLARADAQTDEDQLGDAVRLMTMHRAKGLEYRAMVLARMSQDQVPPRWLGTLVQEERDVELRKERNLVYVAASRARERLFVSWSGKPSALIPLPGATLD